MPGFLLQSDKMESLEMFAHRALVEAVSARGRGEYLFEAECIAWSYAAQARRLLLVHEAHCKQVNVHVWAAGYARRRGHEA